MSLAKIDRNFDLVKKRLVEQESWRGLATEYGFKSHNTAKEIFQTFLPLFLIKYPKYKKLRTYPQKAKNQT